MENKYGIAVILVVAISCALVGGAISGMAMYKPAPSGTTKQQVLSMLNSCDSDIVDNGQTCDAYCPTRFTNGVCIASEVLEPVTYGHGLEGARLNCNQDGYRKMCTCCVA